MPLELPPGAKAPSPEQEEQKIPVIDGTSCPIQSKVLHLPGERNPVTGDIPMVPRVFTMPCRTDCGWFVSERGDPRRGKCAVKEIACQGLKK